MVLDLRVLSRQVIQHISYFNWNSCRTANLLHFEFILIKHSSYEYHQHAIIFQIHHLLSLTIFPLQFTGIARKLTCRIYSRNSYINSPGQHMKYSPNQVNHCIFLQGHCCWSISINSRIHHHNMHCSWYRAAIDHQLYAHYQESLIS